MSSLHRIIYVSRGAGPMSDAVVQEILQVSTARNAALGVSGLLVETGGWFLQVLEGAPSAVRAVYGSIAADRRHGEIQLLTDASVETRHFPDWAMAAERLSSSDAGLLGVIEVEQNLAAGLPAEEALGLLTLIRAARKQRELVRR